MSYKLSKEDKEIKEFSEKLPFGVTKVQFTGAIAEETEAGKDFIEVGVVSKEGVEDSFRCWFVGGAANISFNNLHAIAVHQGKDEKEKAAIRDRMDNCETTDDIVDVLNDVCGNGGELWFTKYYDPKRTYQGQDGNTYRSVNKNGYGYEPKEKPELMPKPQSDAPQSSAVNETFPGAEQLNPAEIPGDDAWSK